MESAAIPPNHDDEQAIGSGGGTPELAPVPDPPAATADNPVEGAIYEARLGLPGGKLRIPENTNGMYVILVAAKPPRGQRADYQEVACIPAHDSDHAKGVVLEEDGRTPKPPEQRGELAKALLNLALTEKRGILLRAVPAKYWPGEIEPTTYVRPEPVLRIG